MAFKKGAGRKPCSKRNQASGGYHEKTATDKKRAGWQALAGGLAFVGAAAEATELVLDGSFENTTHPCRRHHWCRRQVQSRRWRGMEHFQHLHLLDTLHPAPDQQLGRVAIGGLQYLRPYPPGVQGVNNSSDTVTQTVSLTASTTAHAGQNRCRPERTYTMSSWFSSYETQGDFSDLTLSFLDKVTTNVVIGSPVALGGSNFVYALPTGANAKYTNVKAWGPGRAHGNTARRCSLRSNPDSFDLGCRIAGWIRWLDLVSLDVVDTSVKTPLRRQC